MRHLLFCAALLLAAPAMAETPMVQVVGLFPNAAVVSVGGVRKLLKVGQTGPYGITVVSASSKGAVLRIDGVDKEFDLSREYSPGGYAAPQVRQLSLQRGQGGHYWTSGSINGKSVQFLVDTGATSVAISERTARQLGIDYSSGTPAVANTASGVVRTWNLQLQKVSIGGIELLGVDAAVLSGDSPVEPLLGMSFLSRVKWREEQGLLVIESKQ